MRLDTSVTSTTNQAQTSYCKYQNGTADIKDRTLYVCVCSV